MKILNRRACSLLLGLAVFGTGFQAFAQDTSGAEGDDQIETITVVGRATNSVVTSVELETYQANDLADIFRLTPSISVGGSNDIAQKVYVRGLEDSLINVTVDGAPQTSTLFHHIGRVKIDPQLLKEVEVQAGAGEATAGAGAIGGSIRFKTKDVNDLLDSGKAFGGTVKASNFSNNGEQYGASLYGRLSESWGVLAYYNYVDRDNMKDGDGVELEGTAAEQSLIYLKVSGDLTQDQHLSFSYESRDEEGEFTRWPNWSPSTGSPLYSGEGERSTFVANYSFNKSDLVNMEVSAYSTSSGFQRDLFTWFTDISSSGLDVRNTSAFGDHSVTYGFEMHNDEVESGELDGPAEHIEEGSVLGLYAQVHSQLTDSFLLSYGVRWDDYDFEQKMPNIYDDPLAKLDDSEISLNAGFAYDFADAWTVTLGYAEASRGKQVTDGFTVWGTALAPDLKFETVSNVEAALEYNAGDFDAKVAIFQSQIDNVIHDQSSGPVYYENYGTIDTDGFEVDLAYRWDEIDIFLGYAHSTAELDPSDDAYSVDYGTIDLEGYEHSGLGNNRGDTWNFTLNYSPTDTLNFGWNVTHVTDLNNIEVLYRALDLGWVSELDTIDKPGYTFHDVFAEWMPSDNFRVNLAVTNVFDKTYLDHSSVGDYTHIFAVVRGYNEPGRDVRLSATFSF